MTTPPTPPKADANAIPSIWNRDPVTGELELSFHPGQARAWNCESRFIAVLAGTQGGKTSFAPWWLAREIERTADPAGGNNDYLAVTSTFKLFQRKFLPLMIETYEEVLKIGRYWASAGIIEISDPRDGRFWAKKSSDAMFARILLGSAVSPSGLESTTAKAALLDEAGQPEYTIRAWEAIRRRLSLARGRALLPTTVYDLGWLKEAVYDRAKRVDTPHEMPGDAEFAVIHFDSIENPAFPLEEFEAARASMPEWRFNMMYRGLFTRPAGRIYDCWIDADEAEGGHRIRPFTIPDHWHRVLGIDFGAVNTCAGFYALEEDAQGYPTGRKIRYRTYHAAGGHAGDHVKRLMDIDPRVSLVVGGAPSEDQWRQAYLWAGLPVYAPTIADVEVGIDRVYKAMSEGEELVFDDDRQYIDDVKGYSRELDERGEPTTKIKDKEKYHAADTSRYAHSLISPNDPLLPFNAFRHLDVSPVVWAPSERQASHFGGLSYINGRPSGFVLCRIRSTAQGSSGTAVSVEGEYHAPGVAVTKFAQGLKQFIVERGVDYRKCRIACNDDLFIAPVDDAVTGPPLIAAFRAAGLVCVEAKGDGVNEWGRLADWLSVGGLQVRRATCPLLSLTLPLITADPKKPGAPDPRNPLAVAQALCNALMLRPRPSRDGAPVVAGQREAFEKLVR